MNIKGTQRRIEEKLSCLPTQLIVQFAYDCAFTAAHSTVIPEVHYALHLVDGWLKGKMISKENLRDAANAIAYFANAAANAAHAAACAAAYATDTANAADTAHAAARAAYAAARAAYAAACVTANAAAYAADAAHDDYDAANAADFVQVERNLDAMIKSLSALEKLTYDIQEEAP